MKPPKIKFKLVLLLLSLSLQQLVHIGDTPPEKESEPPGISRQLAAGDGMCTNDATKMNLFNTNALASMNSMWAGSSQSAATACDGDVLPINTATLALDELKVIDTNQIYPAIWKITFSQKTKIKTILIVNWDTVEAAVAARIYTWISTVGDDPDVTKNEVCSKKGLMTASGWYMCPELLYGLYFGIYSTTVNVCFFEIMAFSQESIQMGTKNKQQSFPKSRNSVASSPASNAISQLFCLRFDTSASINSSVVAIPPADGSNADFNIKWKAEIKISGIVLLPGYLTTASTLPQVQRDVKVKIRSVQTVYLVDCGIISDYYTRYAEVMCNQPGYEILLQQLQTPSVNLHFQGIGVLADCDCQTTSLDPQYIFTATKPTLVSATTMTKFVGDFTAQTISINTAMPDTISQICGNADGVTKCGSRQIKFFDSSNNELTISPYRGLEWTSPTLTLTGSYQVLGTYTFDVEISLTNQPAVTYRQTVTVSIVQPQCLVPLGLLNLLNTSTKVKQNAFDIGYSQNPSSGCDGVVLYQINGIADKTKVQKSNTPTPTWWRAEFQVQTQIRAFLVINYGAYASKIQKAIATVGDNQDITLNKQCKGFGFIIDGGWWSCDEELLGKFFGLYSNTEYVHFVEAMAFSQETIQLNAQSATMTFEDLTYPAINALQNLVVTYGSGQKCMASKPSTDPAFTITLKASGMIEGVILLPGEYTTWSSYQKDVGVFVEDTYGTQKQCGKNIQDYNTYSEAYCGLVGNKIIVKKFGSNQILAMCGFGALSNCDCTLTSLDPKLMPNTLDSFIEGNTTFQAVQTEKDARNFTISLNQPDTVSTICGLADGLTSCGQRTLTFQDKLTGLTISQWPYKGFKWNSPTLSFTPNQAVQSITVLTVNLSLLKYSNVARKQDITALVLSAKASQTARDATLNATVGVVVNYTLPKLPSGLQYVIVSTQNFNVEVVGNLLSVFGKSDSVNAQVQIQATDSTGKAIYSGILKVFFIQPTQETNVVKNETTDDSFAKIAEVVLLQKDSNCKNCAQPEPSSDTNPPIMTVTKVSHEGLMSLKFDQLMNFTSLFAEINDTSSGVRNLRGQPKTEKIKSNIGAYLLSAKHLNIEIISGGQVNQTMLNFTWQASFINETVINVQLFFAQPAWISSQKGDPEVLKITLLGPSEDAFRSLDKGQKIKDPRQSVSKVLSTQVGMGVVTEALQSISEIADSGGKTVVVSQVVISVLLSSALTQMWTMVNGLQILLTFPLMNVPMPANVYILLTKLNSLNSFDVFDANLVLLSMFTFSETEQPGFGFEQMGVTSKRLILYLQNIFLFILASVVLVVLYAVLWLLRGYWKPLNRLRLKIGRFLYWKFFLRLIIEGCLDLAMGILLSFQSKIFKMPSDIFDFVLTVVFSPIIFGFPIVSYYYLRKNLNLLEDEKFKKYGQLWEGYKIGTDQDRRWTIFMISWFISRRLLLAAVISELQQQTIWLQISLNLGLIISDVWIKSYHDPFESKEGGFLERYNDTICLFLSYFMFLFTDFVPNPDTKYTIGWGFDGLVTLMLGSNVLLITIRSFQLVVNGIRQSLTIRHNKNVMRKKRIKLIAEKTTMRQVSDFFQVSDLIYRDAAYGTESESEEEPEESKGANQVINLQSQLVEITPLKNQRRKIVWEEKRPKYTTLSEENLVQRKKERIRMVETILPSLDLSFEGRLDDFVDLLPSDFSEHSPITRKKDVEFMADLLQSESQIVQHSKVESHRPEKQEDQVIVVKEMKAKAPVSFEVSAEMLTKKRPMKEALIFETKEVTESRQTASTKVLRDSFDL